MTATACSDKIHYLTEPIAWTDIREGMLVVGGASRDDCYVDDPDRFRVTDVYNLDGEIIVFRASLRPLRSGEDHSKLAKRMVSKSEIAEHGILVTPDPLTPQQVALLNIIWERARQQQLWAGTPGEIASPDTTQEHRLAVLAEEFGEVAKEVLEGDPTGNLRTELIQVAAVALAWLEVQE